MIIESFHPGKVKEIYLRFESKGRLMPENIKYVNSWIDVDLNTCFQLMEAPDEEALFPWIKNWEDLADFKIIPVLTSPEAKEQVLDLSSKKNV